MACRERGLSSVSEIDPVTISNQVKVKRTFSIALRLQFKEQIGMIPFKIQKHMEDDI